MRTLRLGRTQCEVPAVSLGTWAYGGLNRVGRRSVGWSGHDHDAALGALRADAASACCLVGLRTPDQVHAAAAAAEALPQADAHWVMELYADLRGAS